MAYDVCLDGRRTAQPVATPPLVLVGEGSPLCALPLVWDGDADFAASLPVCAKQALAYSSVLNFNAFVLWSRLASWEEVAPLSSWHDGPLLLINRVAPNNLAHNLLDDMYSMFTLARRYLGWDPLTGLHQTGAANVTAAWLDGDAMGSVAWQTAYYHRMLPGINFASYTDPLSLGGGDGASSSSNPLTCFSGPVVFGTSGEGYRNSAYAYHLHRTFNDSDRAWGRKHADWTAYLAFYRRAHGLPAAVLSSATSDPHRRRRLGEVVAATPHPARTGGIIRDSKGGSTGDSVGEPEGSIILVQRRASRRVSNMDAVVASVTAIAGGRRIEVRDWVDHSPPTNAAAAYNAAVVVAMHGAGGMWMLGMRPGTAWIDLVPPRASEFANVFRMVAARLGVVFHTQTVEEAACSSEILAHYQDAFVADPAGVAAAVRALLASAPLPASSNTQTAQLAADSDDVLAAISALPAGDGLPPRELRVVAQEAALAAIAASEAAVQQQQQRHAEVGASIASPSSLSSNTAKLYGGAPLGGWAPVAQEGAGASGVRTVCRPQYGVCGSVVLLLAKVVSASPSSPPPPRQLVSPGDVAAFLAKNIKEDARPHAAPQAGSITVDTPAEAGAVAGEGRWVRTVYVDVSGDAGARAAALARAAAVVGGAELVLAMHGSGVIPLLAALPRGSVWVDLVPPRAHAAFAEYLPATLARGVALHTLMLREANCSTGGGGYDAPFFSVDLPALAGVVGLALRSEF